MHFDYFILDFLMRKKINKISIYTLFIFYYAILYSTLYFLVFDKANLVSKIIVIFILSFFFINKFLIINKHKVYYKNSAHTSKIN